MDKVRPSVLKKANKLFQSFHVENNNKFLQIQKGSQFPNAKPIELFDEAPIPVINNPNAIDNVQFSEETKQKLARYLKKSQQLNAHVQVKARVNAQPRV